MTDTMRRLMTRKTGCKIRVNRWSWKWTTKDDLDWQRGLHFELGRPAGK